MAEQLNPFYEGSCCVKCGACEGEIAYHKGERVAAACKHRCGSDDISSHKGPHIHRYCGCGYDWCERPLDQVEKLCAGLPPPPPSAQIIKEGEVPK